MLKEACRLVHTCARAHAYLTERVPLASPLVTSPGYRRIADVLRDEIVSGVRAPGSALPSEADLRQRYGVSRATARRVFQLLREEGLIEIRHGYPTRVRLEPERTPVRIQRGASFLVRLATPVERDEHGLVPGDQVLEVRYGAKVFVFAADRHVFTTA